MIPGADTSLLHPVFRARLDHALNDPRIKGKVRVVSATRTRAQQAALYAAYKAGTGNTAANPDSVTVGAYGLAQRYGSWHMQQPDGYGYAVDLNWSELDPRTAALAEAILQDHRLIRTVFSPQYEPWHWQMSWSDWAWVPTTKDDDMTPEQASTLAQIAADVKEIKRELWGEGATKRPKRTVRAVLSDLVKKP